MATIEEQNLQGFKNVVHTLTGGESGVKSAGTVFVAVTDASRDAAWLREAFTGGKAGVRNAGHVVAQLARIEGQGTAIQHLVKALANVTGGEAFDQDKLLEGIAKTVFDSSKAGAEAGVANAVESIDTTVTIKQEAAE